MFQAPVAEPADPFGSAHVVLAIESKGGGGPTCCAVVLTLHCAVFPLARSGSPACKCDRHRTSVIKSN